MDIVKKLQINFGFLFKFKFEDSFGLEHIAERKYI